MYTFIQIYKLLSSTLFMGSSLLAHPMMSSESLSLPNFPSIPNNTNSEEEDWVFIDSTTNYIDPNAEQVSTIELPTVEKEGQSCTTQDQKDNLDIEDNNYFWHIYLPLKDQGRFHYNRHIFKNIEDIIQKCETGARVAILVPYHLAYGNRLSHLPKIIDEAKPGLFDAFIFFKYDSDYVINNIINKFKNGISKIINSEKQLRIVMFAHGTGGLIVRSALKLPSEFSKGCLMKDIVQHQKDLVLVTFGAPHGGIPFFCDSDNLIINYLHTRLYKPKPIDEIHQSVMTSNTANQPKKQSHYLSCLNSGQPWKYAKNFHLFTLAGNASQSYQHYRRFKFAYYKNYPDHLHDGYVDLDSAFHKQLNYESDSWSKSNTHRLVIPANHDNIVGINNRHFNFEDEKKRKIIYHIVDKSSKIKILDQSIYQRFSQEELGNLYNISLWMNKKFSHIEDLNDMEYVFSIAYINTMFPEFEHSVYKNHVEIIKESNYSNDYTIKLSKFKWTNDLNNMISKHRNEITKAFNQYKALLDSNYETMCTEDKDIDEIIVQALKPWLDEIEQTPSMKLEQ